MTRGGCPPERRSAKLVIASSSRAAALEIPALNARLPVSR
jgi:hypothetical protein